MEAAVVELDVLRHDARQSLLPLYGRHDSPVLCVQNELVIFDTPCKQIHREALKKVLALSKQMSEMISHNVDALQEQVLQDQLVGKPQNDHTVGKVEVPHHDLHTHCVQCHRLQVVGSLQ